MRKVETELIYKSQNLPISFKTRVKEQQMRKNNYGIS